MKGWPCQLIGIYQCSTVWSNWFATFWERVSPQWKQLWGRAWARFVARCLAFMNMLDMIHLDDVSLLNGSIIMKSPKLRIRRFDSPFTKEEEIWIVKRSSFMTPTSFWRAFIKEFLRPIARQHDAPDHYAFPRIIKRFDESSGVTGRGRTREEARTHVTPEQTKCVEEFFTANEKSGIRGASFELDLTFGTIWRILWKELRQKAYRPTRVNRLTDKNKEDWVTFSHWLLARGHPIALTWTPLIASSGPTPWCTSDAWNQHRFRSWWKS